MWTVLMLPVVLLSQVVIGNPSYRDLKELAELLDIEKRYTKEDLGEFIKVCSQDPIELALVVDSSVSIPPEDFKTGQKFLRDFLSNYDIGPGRRQVRVSGVTFGRGVYIEDSFNFNTYKTKEEVLHHTTNMKFRAGTRTDTGDAIQYMRETQMANTRSWAPKIAIVLTDGNSQRGSWTKQQAELAIAENITMFAVGVGRQVSKTELLNIAGGAEERVITADSYEDLKDIKEMLAYKTCELKPKPTTTPMPTPPAPAAEPCREKYPGDINFIFSPASLGVDATSWVTQFISHTISNEELESGFQYGAVSGDCPDDEGFKLKEYSDANSIRARLDKYDRNNLPALVRRASSEAFTVESGARDLTSKIAVIFLGKAKVDSKALNQAIEELRASGVQVFVARTDSDINPSLPEDVRLLDYGSSLSQSAEFVTHICHLDQDHAIKNEESAEDC